MESQKSKLIGDTQEFLPLATEFPIVPGVQEFKLEEANEALILLKQGKIRGAGVLNMLPNMKK